MSKFDGILLVKPGTDTGRKESSVQKAVKELKNGHSKPTGKRSHPDFTQITAYVRKDTHEEVMRRIYKTQEFSELVEVLLKNWLENVK